MSSSRVTRSQTAAARADAARTASELPVQEVVSVGEGVVDLDNDAMMGTSEMVVAAAVPAEQGLPPPPPRPVLGLQAPAPAHVTSGAPSSTDPTGVVAAVQGLLSSYQAEVRSWKDGLEQRLVRDVGQLSSGMGALSTQVGSLLTRVDETTRTVQDNADLAVYAQRDNRRLLLHGERVVELLRTQGVPGVRAILIAWEASFRQDVDPLARDWSSELRGATVFPAERFLGSRVCVEVTSKLCRDELCRGLTLSPLRQAEWPATRVTARLTRHEQTNRSKVLQSFLAPGDAADVSLASRQWLPGRRVQFTADVALVMTEGHQPFRIQLGLSAATVSSLISRALALTPGVGDGSRPFLPQTGAFSRGAAPVSHQPRPVSVPAGLGRGPQPATGKDPAAQPPSTVDPSRGPGLHDVRMDGAGPSS